MNTTNLSAAAVTLIESASAPRALAEESGLALATVTARVYAAHGTIAAKDEAIRALTAAHARVSLRTDGTYAASPRRVRAAV